MKKIFATILVIVLILSLVGCSNECIYGNWEAEGSTRLYLTFDENGIGSYIAYNEDDKDDHIHEYFSYEIRGNILLITLDSVETVECEYSIEDNALSIIYQDRVIEYTRSET